MSKSAFENAKQLLASRLHGMDAAGSTGFEGLMRDVLAEVTGQLFRLAKSGPQGGSDVRTVGPNTIRIGLEGKRYGQDTRLGLDELRAKLVDAAMQDDPVDLWILAATREISVTDQEQLSETGEAHGLSMLVLDWPGGNVLPDLAVLCAEAPNALEAHLGRDAELANALTAIRTHPSFDSSCDRLRDRLTAADIGYAAASDAMRRWMLAGLHDEASAGARLGGRSHNLLGELEKRIPRTSLNDELDRWLADKRPAVLVGDEGVGKTWSFLSWWIEQTARDEPFPLTIFVSAKDVRDESAEEMIVRLLAIRLGMRNQAFWERRLGQWLKAKGEQPRFILVIDGLNQNWAKRDWADFVQPLFDGQWEHRIAVLMTCWPDHWTDLHRLAPLVPEPREIPVRPFSDPELDLLLANYGLSRKGFSRSMLALMKVPRLSRLAITRQSELTDSGDITPERLAYEDWKHRVARRGHALAIGDVEFRDFVGELGARVRETVEGSVFTRSELLERLGRDSGKDRKDMGETLGEIIAGRWLEPGSKPHQFRVNPDLTPFVLGLTLANELKGVADDGHTAAKVAEFLDPFKGQRLGVAILRAATTIALLDAEIGRGARRAILKRWLAEQNFMQVDFDAYWRLIGLDVDLICENLEDIWLARGGTGILTDEILIKGMAQAYRFPEVASHLVQRAERWLGWLWEDPDEGRFLGRVDPGSQRSRENRERTRTALEEWRTIGTSEWPQVELRPDGDVSWFSHRVFGILSFLPRTPFARAFSAWAISRAIMGVPRHFDELSWVFRLNDMDAASFRVMFYEHVERLLSMGDGIATKSAKYLLEALGDRKAQAMLDALEEQDSARVKKRQSFIDLRDPSTKPEEIKREEPVCGAELWVHHRQNGDTDIRFERRKINLARLDPPALGAIAVEAARSSVNRNAEQLWGLLNRINRILILLPDGERRTIVKSIDRVLASGEVSDEKEQVWWRAKRLEILLRDASTVEQIKIIREECVDANELALLGGALPFPDQSVLHDHLSELLQGDDKKSKLISLYYLSQRGGDATLRGWTGLAHLVSDDEPDIRRLALQLSPTTRDPLTMEAIAAGDWTVSTGDGRADRAHKSCALLAASDVLDQPQLLNRADPEVVGLRLRWHENDPSALRDYDQFVRKAIEEALTRRAGPIGDHWVRHDAPMRILVGCGSDTFLPWLDTWLTGVGALPNFTLLSEFPFVDLCRALFEAGAPQAEPLWEKLIEAMDSDIIKNPDLMRLPMVAPAGAVGDQARAKVISLAITDQDLASAAVAALKHGHADWLERIIREDEARGHAGAIARAYTLLGFSDSTPQFLGIWEDFETRRPVRGWLAGVYRQSRSVFQENQWARHWYQACLTATDPASSFAAYELFASCADVRANLWLDPRRDMSGLSEDIKRHWSSNLDDLNKSIKRRSEGWKKTLFFSNTMSQTQWPWL